MLRSSTAGRRDRSTAVEGSAVPTPDNAAALDALLDLLAARIAARQLRGPGGEPDPELPPRWDPPLA